MDLGGGLHPVWRVCARHSATLSVAERVAGVSFLASGVWSGGVPAELGAGGSACGAHSGWLSSLGLLLFLLGVGSSGRVPGGLLCFMFSGTLFQGGRRVLGSSPPGLGRWCYLGVPELPVCSR